MKLLLNFRFQPIFRENEQQISKNILTWFVYYDNISLSFEEELMRS